MDSAEPLAFTPVPLRARADGWTHARQRQFVAALGELGCVSRAARQVGLSRESAYRLRDRAGGASFAAAWDEALAQRGQRPDASRPTSYERAFEGVLVPVMYRGRKTGDRLVYDGRAACAILRNVYAAREARAARRKAAK